MRAAPKIAERTFAFAVSVVHFCKILDSKPGINRTLGQQLLRAGTSIGANLEEAQAAQSSADFVSKCSISLKELAKRSIGCGCCKPPVNTQLMILDILLGRPTKYLVSLVLSLCAPRIGDEQQLSDLQRPKTGEICRFF